jgi:hypothetical protein
MPRDYVFLRIVNKDEIINLSSMMVIGNGIKTIISEEGQRPPPEKRKTKRKGRR